MFELFAQSGISSEWSGWAGAGLLGAVLCWLMFKHLPDKDAQLKEIMDTKDMQFKLLFDASLAEQQRNREAADKEREWHTRRNENIVLAINAQTAELKTAVASMCKYSPRPS